MKKIISEYSEIIFRMKEVDKERTNQLASEAGNDIKDEIKRNEVKDKKKKPPSNTSASSSASKKPVEPTGASGDQSVVIARGHGGECGVGEFDGQRGVGEVNGQDGVEGEGDEDGVQAGGGVHSQRSVVCASTPTSSSAKLNYKQHFISDELFQDDDLPLEKRQEHQGRQMFSDNDKNCTKKLKKTVAADDEDDLNDLFQDDCNAAGSLGNKKRDEENDDDDEESDANVETIDLYKQLDDFT